MSKQNGFTLFEVMIALAIIGTSVPAIISLGSMLFKTVFKTTHSFERILALKNMLVEAHEKRWWELDKKETKNIDFPAMTLNYATKPVSEKSALRKFKNLVVESVDARWHDRWREQSDSVIFFMYKPEKKDEKPTHEGAKK